MTFSYQSTNLESYTGIQYQLFQEEHLLSFEVVLQLWQKEENFRLFFNQILSDSPYAAFFWETPPLSKKTLQQAFEFVLIESKVLAKVEPNTRSFQEHFVKEPSVINFANLGGDAQLIVPCPVVKNDTYTHLANFVRYAPSSQIHQLWTMVGQLYEQNIGLNDKWLSTAGMGVYWVHVRIDSRPKYYRYAPYRT